MRCPSCDRPNHNPAEPCPDCQFQSDPALVEELAHVEWLLKEITTWQMLPEARQKLSAAYSARLRETEIKLGLRLRPFTEQEAAKAWPDLFRREALRQQLAEWQAANLVNPPVAQKLAEQVQGQIEGLLEQLEGHPRPTYQQDDAERLRLVNFILEAVDHLAQNEGFGTPEAQALTRDRLGKQKEKLETRLEPLPAPVAAPQAAAPAIAPPPAAPPAPPIPLRDRLWRTLLSERTLQALLFLGIFLLFAAALSFVVWGWKDFSATLRVAIPTGFTLLFFAMGWYIRAQTHLYRSGIALSAIASLLIPIDFYTVYANFDIPPDYGPAFWLATSLICLAAYVVVTLMIRNQIFGYLVGVAGGSTVLALIELGHQFLGISLDWRTAGLSALALCFTLLSTNQETRFFAKTGFLKPILAEPLRALALITAGALMPLTLGWRYIGRETFDTLHTAMTINWLAGSFIFGWGAIRHRSRSLGLLTVICLPIGTYMAQAAIFNLNGTNPAWHAFGWAILVPLYFFTGHRLLARKDDAILQAHGHAASGWGVFLLVAATIWSFTDLSSGAAVASTHAVLCGAVVLAAVLWQRPGYLYAASILSLTATSFAMFEQELGLSQLSPGWASLAIAHIIIAINAGRRYAAPIVTSGYLIAFLALLPPLFPYNGDPYNGELTALILGNWIALTAWGARLAHTGQAGFATSLAQKGIAAQARFHWLAALPLPIWLLVIFSNRGPLNASLPLALAALAWGLVALSYRLGKLNRDYRRPWYTVGLLVSVAAPIAAFVIDLHGLTPAICLLAVGLLYLADAITQRQSFELAPGGLVTAWGMGLLLYRLRVSFDGVSLALTLLVAVYILAGLWTERKRSPIFTHRFLAPLYLAAHVLSLIVLARVYTHPLNDVLVNIAWTDEMRMWGAINQILLGAVYGLYAWGTYKERWGHVAAWLIMAGGGFVAIAFSQGRGSSAAKGAVGVIIFVLAERALHRLCKRPDLTPRPPSLQWKGEKKGARRQQATIRLAWRLYRRPLLVAGWLASAGVIGLALVRNLVLLGGGRVQQTWAAAGLLMITGLYALSARLFRQARFAWLAALLVFAPWTILTNLGWFVLPKPSAPQFAISWAVLAWVLYAGNLLVARLAPAAYALPLKTVAHVLLPFSLLWGVAHAPTSRITCALAIGLYGLAALLDYGKLCSLTIGLHRDASLQGAENSIVSIVNYTKFLYPALGLVPIWCVYLLRWLLPAARHEHYGLMLLAFGPLGLATGQVLKHVILARVGNLEQGLRGKAASGYALPAYLTGYVSLIVGTMLVAHLSTLLALALLYDALLMLISARLFRHPLWVYPAAAMAPVSLLIALNQAAVPGNRHGWWLIGLAAIYMALAWALRRARLPAYGTAALALGFALIAFGLLPSSQDKTGALWGYGSAALLYTITAAWLRQPLLLTPACALALVPYAITIQQSPLAPQHHGLALFPGALAALAIGWLLDARLGNWQDFPWGKPTRWAVALADRLLHWWALPLYALGFGLAAASPFFTHFQSGLAALNLALMIPLFGWAVYRFRLRIWLLALGLAGHLALIFYLDELGWWHYPAYACARFLPLTLATSLIAMLIEWRRSEDSPLHLERFLEGWSRPLYLLAAFDLVIAQSLSLSGTSAGAFVTLVHALLIAAMASFWLSRWLPYLSTVLGIVSLLQWLSTLKGPIEGLPVALAYLALAYGLVGYGLTFARNRKQEARSRGQEAGMAGIADVWELPLQRVGLGLSFGVLLIAAVLGIDLVGWTLRAMLGFSFREIVEMPTAQMAVGVLALLGLLYIGTAFNHRRLRLGYVAVGMLLAAWMIHAFYVQQWDGAARVQWYAMPAGVYLLGIAYLEANRGNKTLGRWLDYAAVLLMLGSLFWQTLLFGWRYALMLGGEGFGAFWWGSARRLRRFLYTGMMGVVLATVAQLINSLRSINQWIVFGMIGLLIVVAALIIERKLEDIKAWRETLETWE